MKYEHIYVMHGTVTVLYRTPQSFLADIEALLQIYIIVPAVPFTLREGRLHQYQNSCRRFTKKLKYGKIHFANIMLVG